MKLRTLRRREHLASRPWTARERLIVWRGLTGRFAIAIEPLLGTLFFGALTYGIIWRARVAKPHDMWILSPIFGLAALAFLAYFVYLLVAPVIAYRETYKPIYLVDGYIRYRAPDDDSDLGANGYVAVLFADREICCEWESLRHQTASKRHAARDGGILGVRRRAQDRREVDRRASRRYSGLCRRDQSAALACVEPHRRSFSIVTTSTKRPPSIPCSS